MSATTTTPPAATTPAVESRATAAAAVLAELESMSAQSAPEAPTTTTTPTTTPTAEASGEVSATLSDQAPASPDSDPETEKRLAVIRRAEERSRQAIAKERAEALAELERKATEVMPLREQLERFRSLQARAKYEPAAVLAELGLDADDFEHAAKDAYLRSKAAAADPKSRVDVARVAKERAHADDLSMLRQELSALKQQLSQREERATHERAVTAYLDTAVNSATDDTPLFRAMVSKDPARARSELERIAHELAETNGGPVPPADVAIAFEERQRTLLEMMGIDPTLTKRRAAQAATATPRPAPIPGAAPSGATATKATLTRAETVAQTLRDLEAGNVPAE